MKRLVLTACSILLIALLTFAIAEQRRSAKKTATVEGPPATALDGITADGILRHIKTLASDEYEGRGPGTHGEELAIMKESDIFGIIEGQASVRAAS